MEYKIDDIYNAIAYAETGSSYSARNNPWIRTVASNVEGGSNAYGPVQMLRNLVSGARKQVTKEGKPLIDFTEEEISFMDRFEEQGKLFYKYGNEPGAPKEFDYGGSGFEWSDKEKDLYVSVAKKIMNYEYSSSWRADKDINKFIESWRGKSQEQDSVYYKKVKSKLPNTLDSIKTDNKVFNQILGTEKPLF